MRAFVNAGCVLIKPLQKAELDVCECKAKSSPPLVAQVLLVIFVSDSDIGGIDK